MFPVAVAAGNTFVLKPSEQDPGAAMLLAELASEAGLPKCVCTLVTYLTQKWTCSACCAEAAACPPGPLSLSGLRWGVGRLRGLLSKL